MGEDYLLEENSDLVNHTPSIFAMNSDLSKKTRMGSTDEQGNRLSNLPGEERPSLTSVTPYDDDPEVLVQKVEKLVNESREQKKKQLKKELSANPKSKVKAENSLEFMKNTNEELMTNKKVIANDGQAFERKNFVRMNLKKGFGGKGGYKPALRGAAFTNKMMAKKSN